MITWLHLHNCLRTCTFMPTFTVHSVKLFRRLFFFVARQVSVLLARALWSPQLPAQVLCRPVLLQLSKNPLHLFPTLDHLPPGPTSGSSFSALSSLAHSTHRRMKKVAKADPCPTGPRCPEALSTHIHSSFISSIIAVGSGGRLLPPPLVCPHSHASSTQDVTGGRTRTASRGCPRRAGACPAASPSPAPH